MACNFLPHRLEDVEQAILQYLDGQEPEILAPDFPTGGLIINGNDVPNMIKKGRGSVKLRGRYNVEGQNLVFFEIPYGCSTESLLNEVGKLCDSREIEGIAAIRDESNRKGLRLVFECESDVNPEAIAAKLFALTNFQTTVSYNQVALVDKTPTELGLKDCIEIYVKHNISCIKREAEFDLAKAEARKEIVDGLLKALEDIDSVIQLIKRSDNASAAKNVLMQRYNFSEAQAKAILDMKLSKLAHLEKIELENERAELIEKIKNLRDLVFSKENQIEELRKRLHAIVVKYASPRRTLITNIAQTKEAKAAEIITPEDVVVIVTNAGDIKKIPSASFKVQKKTARGLKNGYDTSVLKMVETNTLDSLMLFSDGGKMYKLSVNDIPNGTSSARGVPINTLIKIGEGEKVVAAAAMEADNSAKYVIFITEKGMIKKTSVDEYNKVKRSTGIIATKINGGDRLVNVWLMDDEDIVFVTHEGMAIHFETKAINPVGRVAAGVKGIKLNDNDFVVASVIIKDTTKTIAVFSENGYGKKISIEDFPVQGRAGKGLNIYKDTGITGKVKTAIGLCGTDSVLILSQSNSIRIEEKEIPLLSRYAAGNIMTKNHIVSACVVNN